jgi:hypothetical protein
MISDKRKAYLKAYRERGGEAYKKRQIIAQRKHWLKNPERRRQACRLYQQRKRDLLQRMTNLEKLILQFAKTIPTNKQPLEQLEQIVHSLKQDEKKD